MVDTSHVLDKNLSLVLQIINSSFNMICFIASLHFSCSKSKNFCTLWVAIQKLCGVEVCLGVKHPQIVY